MNAGAVLKKASVREAGPVQLGTIGSQPRPAGGAAKAAPAAQARVVEQDDRSAVIEVVCPCGCRTLVRCITGSPAEPGAAASPRKLAEPSVKEPMP